MNINQELVEKVKSGTHCIEMPQFSVDEDWRYLDILIRTYLDETFPCSGFRFYRISPNGILGVHRLGPHIPIPLSSFFLPTQKMIPVEELERLISQEKYTDGLDEVVFVADLQTLINKYK